MALPKFDIDAIPEQAQITRQLAERLNGASDVNDAIVAIVQAVMDVEAVGAAFLTWLDQQAGR